MLQIRLSKPSSEGGGGGKPSSADSVTVACPDHLILADLPVAKSLGSANATSLLKIVGRRSRRQLGERVHFCVRCDYPIAIYGRLSPCDHVFCLDCARSDSLCYLCDERIQKIQTIKMMEGIFICAAPHCLKSFLRKSEFESHIHETHADLVNSNADRNGNDSEAVSARRPTASESTVQAPPKTLFSPSSNPQAHDYRSQPRDQQPPRPGIHSKPTPAFIGHIQNNPPEQQGDSNPPPGFDRFGPQNHFQQQTFDPQSGLQQPGQVLDRQQGNPTESPFREYPMHPQQPPNFSVPINPNPVLIPPQFGYPPFAPDGGHPYYGPPYEMARPDSTSEGRPERGSLLGFPPGPPGSLNFAEGYPQPWMGPTASPASQGTVDGFVNASDPQGSAAFLQGDYGRNPGMLANIPPPPNQGMERGHSGNSMDPRDGKGILAPQPLPPPPPPPLPPSHMS